MNQATNKTPYGLLSPTEQAQFCIHAKRRGVYEWFTANGYWTATDGDYQWQLRSAYRLKMVEGGIYYCEYRGRPYLFESRTSDSENHAITIYSRCLDVNSNEKTTDNFVGLDEFITTLRPATAEEDDKFILAFEPKGKCQIMDCELSAEKSSVYCEEHRNLPVHTQIKKEKWTLWQKDCGKKKPKKGTYTDLQYQDFGSYNWEDINDIIHFSCATPYRYKKVKK